MPPTPVELTAIHGTLAPEALATALGIAVTRTETALMLPGVAIFSEYQPACGILLYLPALRQLAAQRGESLARLEQWHIAHELYHALAEAAGTSAWRTAESTADAWADELLMLTAV